MRSLRARFIDINTRQVCRVTALNSLANEWEPNFRFLVPITSSGEYAELQLLIHAGLSNVIAGLGNNLTIDGLHSPIVIFDLGDIQHHDIVALNPDKAELTVLYRNSDLHHAIQLTNRCNSNCLMCSQPPTKYNDDWLVDEACQLAACIKDRPQRIGLTGGEPLLLGPNLRLVIEAFIDHHPDVDLDVLTNGRLLSDQNMASLILAGIPGNVSWLVPLYAHADFLHDYIVQSPGAFEETLEGLLTLQSYEQPIQIRVVLIEPVLQHLTELCKFIGRNLPFVREVALMGCEPIGFALANRSACEVDLSEWHEQLREAVEALKRAQVPVLFMNTPFCALPRELWPLASNSISDWKKVFPDDCNGCTLKNKCSGLFAWYEKGWRPTAIRPIEGVQA